MSVKRKIFVINLKDSVDRYSYVKSQFDKLGLEIEKIEGVDANSLTREDIKEVYSPEKNRKTYVRPLHKGQIACYMAHVKAWKAIVEQDLDYAIVLEDDAKINGKFSEALKFFDTTFGRWDFVRVQSNAKLKRVFHSENMGDFSFVQYINTPGNTLAQVVSKSEAIKLLEGLLPFGMPVDTNQQYYYRIGVHIDSLRPPIASTSEIGEDSVLRKYDTANSEHHPFVRQKLSINFYIRRIVWIIREYGIFVFLKDIILMPFRKPMR